jgi:hypothetical protein
MNTITVINARGIPFTVKLVRQGEAYGLLKQLTHNHPDPMVEFYDQRHAGPDFDPEGQFVSRYYLRTLRGLPGGYGHDIRYTGLCLQGDIPAWNIDQPAAEMVMRWLDLIQP